MTDEYQVEEDILYEVGDVESRAFFYGEGDTTIAVIAENHGDEQGPRYVFEKMIDEEFLQEYDDVSVGFIPVANAFADQEVRRKTPLSYQDNMADVRDMNRVYGTALKAHEGDAGDKNYNLTEQAAEKVVGWLDDLRPDLVLDLHSGTSGTLKMPQVRYKHGEEYAADESDISGVARNSGVDFFSVRSDIGSSQILGAVGPKMGLPTLTLEVGGGVRDGWEDSFGQEFVDAQREVLENLFDYAVNQQETDYEPREMNGLKKVYTGMDDGVLELRYEVNLGDSVQEGETVAVTEEDGREIEAPQDGIIETILTEEARKNVKPGNRIFNIATR